MRACSHRIGTEAPASYVDAFSCREPVSTSLQNALEILRDVDFSVYVDADEPVLRDWFVKRFLAFRDTAFHDPLSYWHRYALLSDDEAIATAIARWERANLANLEENILPTRPRATLILKKGGDHVIETVWLRRL